MSSALPIVKRIASASRAPVVPVAIEGAHDIWPRGTSFPRLRGRMLVKAADPIPAQMLVDMGADAAMEFLYDTLEGLRMELRETIRRRSKGVYPPPGPGDADNRDGHRPKHKRGKRRSSVPPELSRSELKGG